MNLTLKSVLTLMLLLPPCITAQHNYAGDAVHLCDGTMWSESLSYTCNGQNSSCRAFLILTAVSPYDTVAAIANLTSSDQYETARINNVTMFGVLPEGQEVIVPVRCSCSGQSYGANTTYQILPGQRLLVPLRCACPTAKQAAAEIKFLLTDEFVTLQPFTTILIPLPSEPSYWHAQRSPDSPPLPVRKSRPKRVDLIVGIAAGAFSLLILLLLALFFQSRRRRTHVTKGRGRNAEVPSPKDLILEIAKLDRILKVYKFSDVKKATRDFGSRRRIKDHGYRGTFNGEVFARVRVYGKRLPPGMAEQERIPGCRELEPTHPYCT